MKLYLAGTSVSNPIEEPTLQKLFQQGSKLHSYYHCVEGFEKKWYKMNKMNKVDLFLDSGAFSAMTQGVKIDIYEYIDFIKEHEDVLEVYANLDVIGSVEGTWKNQMIMEEAGLKPLPVFHYGEDEKWLQRYLRAGYEYIALGGMVKTPNLIMWLDNIWHKYLTDDSGMPIIKVHGFGLTSLSLMLRYPWYSVDSTSWVVTGRLGGIYMPFWRGGEWVYDENSWKISVSNKSPDLKEGGRHYQTMSPLEQKRVMQYLEEKGYKMGKSSFRKESQEYQLQENEKWAEKKPKDKKALREVETIVEPGVSNMYQLRDEVNIIYFLDLEKHMPEYPWPLKKEAKIKGFF